MEVRNNGCTGAWVHSIDRSDLILPCYPVFWKLVYIQSQNKVLLSFSRFNNYRNTLYYNIVTGFHNFRGTHRHSLFELFLHNIEVSAIIPKLSRQFYQENCLFPQITIIFHTTHKQDLILVFCILLLVFLDIYNYLCNINTFYINIL